MSVETFLSATANGVYQGTLVAALVGLVLRLFRTNAATRYAVWFGTLLLVAALIPVHLFLANRERAALLPPATTLPGVTIVANAPNQPEADAAVDELADSVTFPELQATECDECGIATRTISASVEAKDEAPVAEVIPKDGPGLWRSENSKASTPPPISNRKPWNLEASISLPHSICLGLLAVWILVASVRGVTLARRLADVRRLKASSHRASEDLESLFTRLRDSLRTKRSVGLSISDSHRTAVVLGFIHPAVLLPGEMDEPTNRGEAEDVLRHELAHVDRWDDWGNLLQQII